MGHGQESADVTEQLLELLRGTGRLLLFRRLKAKGDQSAVRVAPPPSTELDHAIEWLVMDPIAAGDVDYSRDRRPVDQLAERPGARSVGRAGLSE